MKLIRTTTVPQTLNTFCKGLLKELKHEGYEVVAVSSPGKELEEIANSEGIRTIALPMERRISPFKDIKSLWQMWRLMRRENTINTTSTTPMVIIMAGVKRLR